MRRHREHQPDGARERSVERCEGVRGDAGPQRLGLFGVPQPGQDGRREHRPGSEPGHHERVARDPQDRLRGVGEQRLEVFGRWAEQALPTPAVLAQLVGGAFDRVVHRPCRPVVQRVHAVDLGLQPPQPVAAEIELRQVRRPHRHRVERRAVVVDQAGDDLLRTARPAADRGGSLQHRDLDAGARQARRGGEPVRPAADDDRRGHRISRRRRRTFPRGWSGTRRHRCPDSGSANGRSCRSTARAGRRPDAARPGARSPLVAT